MTFIVERKIIMMGNPCVWFGFIQALKHLALSVSIHLIGMGRSASGLGETVECKERTCGLIC